MNNEQEHIKTAVTLAEKWQNRATELVSDMIKSFM